MAEIDRESDDYREAYRVGQGWREQGVTQSNAIELIVQADRLGSNREWVAGLTNGYADAIDAEERRKQQLNREYGRGSSGDA